MQTRRAEQDYRERVARVVAAIVADPMGEHRLEDLAQLAHFSPFHFHRVYRSIAGETVAATIRRVRLALATRLLSQGDQSITQVGLAVGYESPQAFTRAFGQFTGQSPREFQGQMRAAILDLASTRQGEGLDASPAVRIVERQAQAVCALRHHGPFTTIPLTHRLLRASIGTSAATSIWLGISRGDPDDMHTFSYHAATVLLDSGPIDDEKFARFDVPGGLYAVHRLTGPHTRINAAVHALYSRWLPGSGYEPDERPTLEHYLTSPRQVGPALARTDLMIPIRPAG